MAGLSQTRSGKRSRRGFRRWKVVVRTVIVAGTFGSSDASAVHVSHLRSPIKKRLIVLSSRAYSSSS